MELVSRHRLRPTRPGLGGALVRASSSPFLGASQGSDADRAQDPWSGGRTRWTGAEVSLGVLERASHQARRTRVLILRPPAGEWVFKRAKRPHADGIERQRRGDFARSPISFGTGQTWRRSRRDDVGATLRVSSEAPPSGPPPVSNCVTPARNGFATA